MTAIKKADPNGFRRYKRIQVAELRPYIAGEDIPHVSISDYDKKNGSPKVGDMVARNPKKHEDQWLVAADYFLDNFIAFDLEEFVSL